MRTVKLLVVGDRSVGKTSLCYHFMTDRFAHVSDQSFVNYYERDTMIKNWRVVSLSLVHAHTPG